MAAPARPAPPAFAGRRDHVFYLAAAAAFLAIVFAGFKQTWFLRGAHGLPPLPFLLQLHGVLFTLWIALFVVQPLLVARKRLDLHRQLGVAGGVLAALMTVVVPLTAVAVTKPGYRPGPPTPLSFLTIPFFSIAVFAILVGAALLYRKRPDIHKRLMLVATLSILSAAVARIPLSFIANGGALAFYGLTDLLLLPCIAYDAIIHRKLHPAYLCGGLLLLAYQPLSVYVGKTAGWLAFAGWLTN